MPRKKDNTYPVDINTLTQAEKDAALAKIRAQSLPREQAMDQEIQEHIRQEQESAAQRGQQPFSDQARITFL